MNFNDTSEGVSKPSVHAATELFHLKPYKFAKAPGELCCKGYGFVTGWVKKCVLVKAMY